MDAPLAVAVMDHSLPEDSGLCADANSRRLFEIARLTPMPLDPGLALVELAGSAARIFGSPGATIQIDMGPAARFEASAGDGEIVVPNAADPPPRPAHIRTDMTPVRPRFQAGVPLINDRGQAVGVLSLREHHPRSFSSQDLAVLAALAARIVAEMEVRVQRRRLDQNLETAVTHRQVQAEVLEHTVREVRSPLNVVKGITQLLAEDPRMPLAMRLEFLNTISDQVDRSMRLIVRALDISRLEMGQALELSLESLDLAELVRRVTASCDPGFAESRFAFHAGPGPLLVRGDRERLEGVVHKLCTNALRFSPPLSPVTVRCERNSDTLHLSVMDEGCGMDADQVARLFRRYSILQRGGQHGLQHCGLGMFLTRHVVEVHGGSIWVESKPDQGAAFHVVLPAA